MKEVTKLTKNGNPMSWEGVARKAGLHDPHARLRQLWLTLREGERMYLVKAAGLPEGTVLNQVLNDGQAEQLKSAICRASSWAQKLEKGIY